MTKSKVTLDVEEIKRSVLAAAMTAKSQLSEFAKRAQHDLSQKHVKKTLEGILGKIKAHELMQNPKVQEVTKKLADLSLQIEKLVTTNAAVIVDQVKTNLGRAQKKAAKKKNAKKGDSSH